MKKSIKTLILFFLLSLPIMIFAQPHPNNGGGGPGGGNAPVGAPLGSGLVILLSLGIAYGGSKVYQWRKKD